MIRLFCIITDAANGDVLLRPGPGGWQLPQFDLADPGDTELWEATFIRKAAAEQFGLDLWPVYTMRTTLAGRPCLVSAFEWHGGTEVGVGWQAAPTAKAGRRLADPERVLLEGHAASQDLCARTGIVPWLRTGWREEVETWILAQLTAQGIALTSHPDLVTSRFTGRVLRMETSVGRIYFKAIAHVWCRDVAITRELSAWQPRRIPAPLAADPARGWMLTAEVTGPTLTEVTDMATWEEAARCYAQLQRASVSALAGGSLPSLFDWRPEVVGASLEALMEDLERLGADYDDPLTGDELRTLRQGTPRFAELCRQVADSGLPAALEHQDLHPGNVRIAGGRPVFLDWAWASVTHPFLSLGLFLAPNQLPQSVAPERARLLRAYFEVWSDYGTPEQLGAVAQLVHRWSIIQYAITDAEWLRSYLRVLPPGPFPREWYLSSILQMRQYYWTKCLRRMPGINTE